VNEASIRTKLVEIIAALGTHCRRERIQTWRDIKAPECFQVGKKGELLRESDEDTGSTTTSTDTGQSSSAPRVFKGCARSWADIAKTKIVCSVRGCARLPLFSTARLAWG